MTPVWIFLEPLKSEFVITLKVRWLLAATASLLFSHLGCFSWVAILWEVEQGSVLPRLYWFALQQCAVRRGPQALLLIIYTVSLGALLTHCRWLPVALDFSHRLHDTHNKTHYLTAPQLWEPTDSALEHCNVSGEHLLYMG